MDRLQVIALCFEIIGLSLAFIQIYSKNYKKTSIQILNGLKPLLNIKDRIYGMSSAVDDESSLTSTQKNSLVEGNCMGFMIIIFVLLPLLFSYIDFGSSYFWLFLEIPISLLLAMILVIPTQVLLHVSLSLFIRGYFYLIELAGKGDLVGGMGLSFALMGISIETYQVWNSSLNAAVYYIWGVVFLIFIGLVSPSLFRRARNRFK